MNKLQKDSETKSPARAKLQFSLSYIFSFIKNIFASTQNIIGLDIGTSYIKIVQVQKTRGGKALITNRITRAIPTAVKDNPESKRKLVQEFVKEFIANAPIKTKLARLIISGKGVFIFSLSMPAISKKDLREAVSIELKKRVPFQMDLDSISFDYFVTKQFKDERGASMLRVTCIAVDNNLITEGVELLKQMNLRPIGISALPDALSNLIPLCLNIKSNQTIAILDLGASSSVLNFYKGDMLEFSREIPIGGEHITKAMTKSIVSSIGTINLTVEEAEKVKRQCGIPLEDEQSSEYYTDYGVLRGSQIFTMSRPILGRLVTELIRTFNYYTTSFHVPKIEGLYLTGGSSRLKNIDRFLLSNLEGISKVERLNTLKAVKGWADISISKQELVIEQAAPHLSAAFGVCLAGGGKVNFLPLKEKLEQKADFMMVLAKAFFPIILVLVTLFYSFTYLSTFRYKNLISEAKASINKLQPTVDKINEYLALKSKINQRKSLLEKAVGRQPLWWGVLKELSVITPQEVTLEKIATIQSEELRQIRLTGEILAKYTTVDLILSQYLVALDESPFFNQVQLVSTQKDMYSVIPRARFEIICQLNY